MFTIHSFVTRINLNAIQPLQCQNQRKLTSYTKNSRSFPGEWEPWSICSWVKIKAADSISMTMVIHSSMGVLANWSIKVTCNRSRMQCSHMWCVAAWNTHPLPSPSSMTSLHPAANKMNTDNPLSSATGRVAPTNPNDCRESNWVQTANQI